MHARLVSRHNGAMATAALASHDHGWGRMAVLAAMVALLALTLIRPAVGANQSGPTVSEISWALSGLCRLLGGIDDVNPTRYPGSIGLLNVYFKCKGGYLDGLDCKIGDAGDPTKGSCTFKSAPSPSEWAVITRVTNGALHDLVSVNGLVQVESPAQWATISQVTHGAIQHLEPVGELKAGADDADRGSHRDAKHDGKGKAKHGKGKQRDRD